MTARLRELNDQFRQSFVGGRVVLTAGVAALPSEIFTRVIEGVKAFDRFDADNDPYNEHDFGSFVVGDSSVFWKVDVYDRTLRFHSPEAGNPDVTTRVLTIGLSGDF